MCDPVPPDPPFRTRTQVLFARDAPKAVILRRGPKRHFNLLTWDLKSDTISSGQWMKGIVKLCDLSPCGDKLLYWAAQYHASATRHVYRERADDETAYARWAQYDPAARRPRPEKRHSRRKTPRYMRVDTQINAGRSPTARDNEGVWTAVSTPPYFSALAIWPCFGHWTGGGIFGSEWEIKLFEGRDGITPVVNVTIPSKLRITPVVANGRLEQPLVDCAYNPEPDKNDASVEAAGALEREGARWVDWVNTRAGDDLLFACDGCVYRLNDWRGVPPDRYLENAWLLADLRPLEFQMVRAPGAAMRW